MRAKLFVLIGIVLIASGCNATNSTELQKVDTKSVISVTDSALRTVELQNPPQTVFSLSSSLSEIWLLAGGKLSGVTNDATTDRQLGLPEDILMLGTVKDPNIEIILSKQPDFVLLSQDIASQLRVSETLQNASIPHYMAKTDTLAEYLKVLGDFAFITGNEDSLYQNGELVKKEVDSLLARLPQTEKDSKKTALFLRAYSSNVKVKAKDHTVCYILDDIGVANIANREGFPLEELSVEAILQEDPDYIFIVAMGDENAAKDYLSQSLFSNPAWSSLSAIKNDNLIMLPKNLYHYKPNNRWGEAYEYILKIIYPEIYK